MPRAVIATALVVGFPCAAVIALRTWGAISSPVLLILAAMALSVGTSQLGAALWKRRSRSGDLLFRDLMLWGWVRRWRFERLLARVPALIGPNAGDGLSAERRVRVLARLSGALESRDPYTHGHSRRVARHAAALAKWMSLPAEQIARIRTAAMLHDVGKIETPRQIVEKREPLSDSEYEVVKRHAVAGAVMVASLEDPELTAIVRHHHERADGSGYPDGLAAEEIPIGARIVAVADTFDAVTSARPYRTAMSHKQALALLGDEAGGQLDPRAVRAFRSHYSGAGPVALCAGLLGGARQLGEMLVAQLGPGAAASKVAAVAAATVVVGASALQSSPLGTRSGGEPPTAHKSAPGTLPSSPHPGVAAGGTNPVSAPSPEAAPTPTVSPSGQPVAASSPSQGRGDNPQAGADAQPATAGGAGGSAPVAPPLESVLEGVGSLPDPVTPTPPALGGVPPAVQQLPGAILDDG